MSDFEITSEMIDKVDKFTERIMEIKRKFDSNPGDEQISKKYKILILILLCLDDTAEESINNKKIELIKLQEICDEEMSDVVDNKCESVLKEKFEILIDDYYCNINNQNSLKQTFNLTKNINHENIIFV